MNDFALIGQFGLSLVMPIIICVLICHVLVSRGVVGTWVYIPGFILGIGASAMTAYKFYLYVMKKDRKDKKKKVRRKGVYFNRHI